MNSDKNKYKIEVLKEIIKKSNNIVFFGGAGVSTESNIPDFRGNGGLYKNKEYHHNPEEILFHDFFVNHPKEFYDYYLNEMIYPNAIPNACHKALAKLEKMGKLKAIITQNIDGLHQAAGSINVIELHGSVKRNYCTKCNNFMNEDELVLNNGKCNVCHGIMKPDVVLYGEMLNEKSLHKALEYITNADTLIVGGTSLVVYPAAGLIRYFRGRHLVLINEAVTEYDGIATLVIHDKIGKVLNFINEEY